MLRASACAVAVASAFLLGYSFRRPAPAVRPCASDGSQSVEVETDTPPLKPRRARGSEEHRADIWDPSGHRTEPKGMLPQPPSAASAYISPHAPASASASASASAASASASASLPSPSALSQLVSGAAVRATLGGRLSAQHARSYGCTFRLIGGTLYRGAKCKPGRGPTGSCSQRYSCRQWRARSTRGRCPTCS